MRINSLFPKTRRPEPARSQPHTVDAGAEVRALNQEYIDAAEANDAAWFQEYLAEDVVVILGDGRRLRKPQFLAVLKDDPKRFKSLKPGSVTVRVFGGTVQADADVVWELTDGYKGTSRYIDTYAWLDGRWQVISAQITLLPLAAE